MFLLRGHQGPVQSVAFGKDGRTLLSVGGWAARLSTGSLRRMSRRCRSTTA